MGWIDSLIQYVETNGDFEKVICFLSTKDEIWRRNNITFISLKSFGYNHLVKLGINLSGKLRKKVSNDRISKVILEYQPDIIQVFGTEGSFSQVQFLTTIPVVYHIQGLINPLKNMFFPPGVAAIKFQLSRFFFMNSIRGNNPYFDYKRLIEQGNREAFLLKRLNFAMGRTHWDEMILKTFNPKLDYFHVEEVLRTEFYKELPLKSNESSVFTIISTISPSTYKGIDVILKVAELLKEHSQIKFRWLLIGISQNSKIYNYFVQQHGKRIPEIQCLGVLSANDVVKNLDQSSIYVHPSLMENSSNAVCEAQMRGLPVVAFDIGGMSSIVENNKNGFLIPFYGIFEMFDAIVTLNRNVKIRNKISVDAREIALRRHNPQNILNSIKLVYSSILKLSK
jgi:glycosyltransferase involved in cell wall biosynthesis